MPPLREEIVHQAGTAVNTGIRKMSPFAVSIGMCSIFFAVSATIVIWKLGPLYIEGQKIAADADHMRQAHEKCEARLAVLEAKVRDLEARKVASN